jgi:hypothetical protein
VEREAASAQDLPPVSRKNIMHLTLHLRALALVVALSTAAAIIMTIAETGHPAPDGQGVFALLTMPQP